MKIRNSPARRLLPQIFRHAVQVGVVVFIVYAAALGPWRNFKSAHNSRRLVELMEGPVLGKLYGANDDALGMFGESLQASYGVVGMPWASTVGGHEAIDPILAMAHVASTRSISFDLWAAALGPIFLALLLGKVFCSYLCPMRLLFEMGQAVRRGLLRAGVSLPRFALTSRLGGFVLVGGLAATVVAGMGVWVLILPYLSASVGTLLLVSTGTATAAFASAIVWFAIDLLLAPGLYCKNLCPTGFVLGALGRWSLRSLNKAEAPACPSGCSSCQDYCPYSLSPRLDPTDSACDACGACVVACPKEKLSVVVLSLPRKRGALPIITSLLFVGLFAGSAQAHHIKGLPHYGYFENYPQTPTDEYVVIQRGWEMGATVFNFQGITRRDSSTPNDVKIYLYIFDVAHERAWVGPVDFEIVDDDGAPISKFTRAAVDQESIYVTREMLPHGGDYTLIAHLPATPAATIFLPFSIDLATDAVNGWVVGGVGVPLVVLFALAVHGRSRRRRRMVAPLFGLLLALSTPVQAGEAVAPPMASAQDSSQHEDDDGTHVMVMSGLPRWLFLVGVGGVIVVSFVAVELFGAGGRTAFRFNLAKNKRVYRLLRRRELQAVPQLLTVGVLVVLVYAGLFGSRAANITPVAVWTLWWAGLIFAVALVGPLFCFACPWDGLANLVTRLRVAARVQPLSLSLPFPRWLANLYPAIALFTVLTWLELGFGVTTNPRTTAYLGLGMVGLAVAGALLFDGKRFCAHACPVGRISGIYANFSPVEIRSRNPRTCQSCTTEDCKNGNDRGYPCPTGISLKIVDDATNCTLCTECIKSCNKQNVAINIRAFGADLAKPHSGRADEAWLCVALLALTLFHGLSMTPVWENLTPGSMSVLKWMAVELGTPPELNFSVAMAVAVAIPIGLYVLSCWIASQWTQRQMSTRDLFIQYSFSVLPVALFYHLAHNAMHLVMEGGTIVSRLSDPLGTGADFFGTRDLHVGSLLGDETLWVSQVVLILVGHVFGIVVAHRIGHRLFPDRHLALRSLLPMLVMMVLLSTAGLGLMHLDMNMRMGRM